jgi:hypothetical protein
MSTLKTNTIQHISSSTPSALTTSTGDLTNAAGISYMGGNKNLLYNGAMQIHQRSTSVASITSGDYRTADRWYQGLSSLGTWTQSVENDAPTGSGLRKSLKLLCTTADASPAASDVHFLAQFLEGQDLQRIAKGTSAAQQITLSFWVKASTTGTYIAELQDADNTRAVSAAYTISASATWERKTITFPADTTGAFDNDNAGSLYLNFWLGAGSDRTSGTLQTTWASTTNANRVVGQTNLSAATNNYWQMTGAQLEVGSVATSFEFKSYGNELRECQRYYEICNIFFAYIGYKGGCVYFNVQKRTTPNLVTFYSGSNGGGTVGQLTEANSSGSGYNVTAHEAHIRSIQSIATSYSGTTNFAGSVIVSAEL